MDVSSHPATAGRTVFGKPLGWSRGWTVVVTVWAVAAVLLVTARVDVGHVTALSAREAAAIDAVEGATVDSGVAEGGAPREGLTTAQALQLVLRRYGGTAGEGDAAASRVPRPQWFTMDRPWEDRVYVYWEFGDYEPLAWAVDDDGTVTPDGDTRLLLAGLARLEAEGKL